ncbi:MAG: hypothetical protein VZR95_00510 [Alphaproteobacteria bacterium]
MEIVFLPAWATFCAIAAIIGLVVFSLLPTVKNMTATLAFSAKSAYYIGAIVIAVALAAFFCIAGGINTSIGVLIAYGVILFFGLVACAVSEGSRNVVKITAGVVVICLVLATLAFSNVAYAAIWIAVVGAEFFIGNTLFPAKK